MATEKKTAAKQYLLVDEDGNYWGLGTWDQIIEWLESYNEGWNDHEFAEWLSECEIYELGTSKKLKYTPSKFEIK